MALKPGTKPNIEKTIYCRAFRHRFDGNVFQETRQGRTVWVAYLECLDCGSTRRDMMSPYTCQLTSRDYDNPDDYDTTMSQYEAKKLIFTRMFKSGGPMHQDVPDNVTELRRAQ